MTRKLLIFCCCMMLFATTAYASDRPPLTLDTAQKEIAAGFIRLDSILKKAAIELGETGITGEAARKVLTKTCNLFNSAVDCCTVSPQGRMITVEPSVYRRFEGMDISNQEQVIRMLKHRKPVISPVFRSVEGFDAVDCEYPIFNRNKDYIGSVSILFRPEKFLGDIISKVVKAMPLDIWVMEKNGRILYDVDSSQIGLNLFTSPGYQPFEQLVRLGQKIAGTEQGSGFYQYKSYPSGIVADKKAYWQSVSIYGNDWKLVGIHIEPKTKTKRAERPASKFTAVQMLERFAGDAALQTALASDSRQDQMKLLQAFYDSTPGIYSVQWIDTNGINRCGSPAENSLSDYDYHSFKAPSDKETLRIIENQQPASFSAPLFEGKTGTFVFRPVFKAGRYLGMVYTITLNQT